METRGLSLVSWFPSDMNTNPLIVALDFESGTQARALVDELGDGVNFYKVGMELYAAEGIPFVQELIGAGKDVFLDLKLYDIGETVRRAVARLVETGVRFLTVHGSGAVMKAAVAGRGEASTKLLAVTVLTSFDQSDLTDLGYPCSVADLVDLRVRKAVEAGIDGIVCSPLDAARVRTITGPGKVLVTPGVRSRSADVGDQKRVATPAEAIRDGANFLVMGRQVTRAANPGDEVKRILAEIRG